MGHKEIQFGLFLGVLLVFCINWIYFFDWTGMLGWIYRRIAPDKPLKEFEDNRKLRKSKAYKGHLRKWKLIFLLVPALFAAVYLLFAFITKKSMGAFLCALLAVLFA